MTLLLHLVVSLMMALTTATLAQQPRRRIVGAELLGTSQIPRNTMVSGADFVVGGLSGLSSDPSSARRIYAVSDRGDVFSATVDVSTTDGLRVVLDSAFHVNISGGEPSRPRYVDAEGIAVCRSTSDVAAPLLISTEDPPRVARLSKADGTMWTTGLPPALMPVQLSHIINASSTRRNGQLESLSCWTGGDDAQGIAAAAASPTGGTIFTANELSLHQDSEPPELWDTEIIGGSVRIFQIDRSTGEVQRTTRYVLDRRSGNGLVDLEVVGPNGSLLAMERAYQHGVGNTIKVYAVDSLTEVPDATRCISVSEWSGCASAVSKRLVLDLGTVDGLELDNYEGMAVLPQPLADGRRVLLLVNDNNFDSRQLPTTFVALALTEEVTLTLSNDIGSLVGTIRAVPQVSVLDGIEGRYTDPNRGAVEPVAAFRGIPFASPPIGRRRFRPPEPYRGPYAAGTGRQLGAACPQTPWLSYYAPEPTSEDCLFLNVYTPASQLESMHNRTSSASASSSSRVDTANGVPVLVFLHGGSFLWGSSSIFDGSKLAATEGMVVVSCNYRLGVLGMLPTPPVPPATTGEANYGLMDQQMALQWVHRWAHRFGGDQSRIMLMGESAGAVSVLLHLALPASGPGRMFASAAVHSAPCVAAPHQLECVSSLEKVQRTVSDPLVAAAGCASSPTAVNASINSTRSAGLDNEQLNCLRSLPVERIVELTHGLTGAAFHPVFGVSSVPTDPIATLMAEGTPVRRVILGWNQHDGTQFAPGSWAADSETNATHCCPVPIPPVSEAVWTEQLRAALGQQPGVPVPGRHSATQLEAQARALYSSTVLQNEANLVDVTDLDDIDRWWQLVRLITDTEFSCPMLALAERLSDHYATRVLEPNQADRAAITNHKADAPSWDGVRVFRFNQRSWYSHAPPRWGVYHASELQYIFDVRYPYLLGASDYTAAERALMRSMQRMWAAVARGYTGGSIAHNNMSTEHAPESVGPGDALTWLAFSTKEPWLLQLEAASEAAHPSEGSWRLVNGTKSATRCSFWEHAVGYYSMNRDTADAKTNQASITDSSVDGVLGSVLILLLVGGLTGMGCRRRTPKSGSYESLQASDTQSEHDKVVPSASTSKQDDGLATSP